MCVRVMLLQHRAYGGVVGHGGGGCIQCRGITPGTSTSNGNDIGPPVNNLAVSYLNAVPQGMHSQPYHKRAFCVPGVICHSTREMCKCRLHVMAGLQQAPC